MLQKLTSRKFIARRRVAADNFETVTQTNIIFNHPNPAPFDRLKSKRSNSY